MASPTTPPNTSATNSSSSSTTLTSITASTLPTPSLSAFTISNILHHVSIKLECNTYLLWRAQFMLVLQSQDILSFVDGTNSAPAKYLPGADASVEPTLNPAYSQWHKIDQLIQSWFFATSSPSVLGQSCGHTTSRAMWTALERQFASPSQSRIMQLRFQLQTLKKGCISVSEYFDQAKELADQLSATGHPVPNHDLMLYLLGGLGTEFEPFVMSVTSRTDPLDLEDFHGLLLTQEHRIALQSQLSVLNINQTSPIANIVQKGASPDSSSFSHRGGGSHHGGGRSRGRGGRGRGNDRSGGYPPCQLCRQYGHPAARCPHRFDHHYQTPIPSFSSPIVQTYQIPQHLNPTAALHTGPGLLPSPPISSAFSSWYPDSRATHHMTSDIGSFLNYASYPGSDHVTVGNGASLQISNIGTSRLSPHLILNNVLHVPGILKNLLSISQLTRDHDCIVVFTVSGFIVKDRKTGHILLQGPHRDGLYCYDPPSRPRCFLGEKVSGDTWHRRLGHPTPSIVRQVVSSCGLSSSELKFCDACQLGKSHRLPFLPSTFKASRPLELIYADVWGPAPLLSVDGMRYYITFVDSFSRFTWIFYCALKSEIFGIFTRFHK
ncbi:hypothetical protein Dimus_037931 [Dionaea muscipula]